jgi:hypothetical protein
MGEQGAVCMGSGWGPDWTRVFSTENNLDYYAALKMIKDLYLSGDPKVVAVCRKKNFTPLEIDIEMRGVLKWMKKVAWNPLTRSFNRGVNESGVDRVHALDTATWALSALGPELMKQMDIDPYSQIELAEKEFRVQTTVMDVPFEGFDFTNLQGRKRNIRMIWAEGTGQQIVAYAIMARYAAQLNDTPHMMEYRAKAVKYNLELQRLAELVKMENNALPYTTLCPGEAEVILTFEWEWELPRGYQGQWVASLSSTIWRYFALKGFNPLSFEGGAIPYAVFEKKPASANYKPCKKGRK